MMRAKKLITTKSEISQKKDKEIIKKRNKYKYWFFVKTNKIHSL
jgi:hypothetical protein